MIKIETYLEDYLYNDVMEAFYMDNIEQFKYVFTLGIAVTEGLNGY